MSWLKKILFGGFVSLFLSGCIGVPVEYSSGRREGYVTPTASSFLSKQETVGRAVDKFDPCSTGQSDQETNFGASNDASKDDYNGVIEQQSAYTVKTGGCNKSKDGYIRRRKKGK